MHTADSTPHRLSPGHDHPHPRGGPRRRLGVALLALLAALAAAVPAAATTSLPTGSPTHRPGPRPSVVLVHGAWADSSSWSGVVERLQDDGYHVLAPPNPLRSLSADAAYLRTYLDTVDGPVVLVGHSYGASVITGAAVDDADVRALVYVNGSVPDEGETVAELAGPDSALSVADPTTIFDFVPGELPPGPGSDVYLKRSTFRDSFATGLRRRTADVLWATQRPITLGALNEPAGEPAWKTHPSWYLIGTEDEVIPSSAQYAMATKAGSTVSRFHAGHLGLITDPGAVVRVIERAARATG